LLSSCYKLLPPPEVPEVIGHLPVLFENSIFPENKTTYYGTDVYLDWYADDDDGDIESYDLYFGTQIDPPLYQEDVDLNNNGFYINNLEGNMTYYWRIIVKDKYNELVGPVWNFKTTLIGREIYGGIVFYLDGSGEHGLVCTKNDLNYYSFIWGENGQNYNAFGDGIGAGIQNTQKIVDLYTGTQTTAAKACYNLSENGYTDWYLPSLTELNYMYLNLKLNDLGSLSWSNYWSSTESNLSYANVIDFDDGTISQLYKSNSYKVRAIRQF
jgi:hypothetical protein